MPDPTVLAESPEAKIARLEAEVSALRAASPTGKALVPAALVPYVLGLLAIVGALLFAGAGSPPMLPVLTPYMGQLGVLELVLFTLLGASPGLRRAIPMALVLVLALPMLSGCATIDRAGPKIVDCFAQECVDAGRELAPDIAAALARPAGQIPAALDTLKAQAVAKGGTSLLEALGCSLVAILGEMSAGSAPPPLAFAGTVPPDELQVKAKIGRQWLDQQGMRFQWSTREP
jgi:hypothetical protein